MKIAHHKSSLGSFDADPAGGRNSDGLEGLVLSSDLAGPALPTTILLEGTEGGEVGDRDSAPAEKGWGATQAVGLGRLGNRVRKLRAGVGRNLRQKNPGVSRHHSPRRGFPVFVGPRSPLPGKDPQTMHARRASHWIKNGPRRDQAHNPRPGKFWALCGLAFGVGPPCCRSPS